MSIFEVAFMILSMIFVSIVVYQHFTQIPVRRTTPNCKCDGSRCYPKN